MRTPEEMMVPASGNFGMAKRSMVGAAMSLDSAMINGFSYELQQIHKVAMTLGTTSAASKMPRGYLGKRVAGLYAVPGEAVKTLEASRAARAAAAASDAAAAAKRKAADEAAQRLGKGSIHSELKGMNLPQFRDIAHPTAFAAQ